MPHINNMSQREALFEQGARARAGGDSGLRAAARRLPRARHRQRRFDLPADAAPHGVTPEPAGAGAIRAPGRGMDEPGRGAAGSLRRRAGHAVSLLRPLLFQSLVDSGAALSLVGLARERGGN